MERLTNEQGVLVEVLTADLNDMTDLSASKTR